MDETVQQILGEPTFGYRQRPIQTPEQVAEMQKRQQEAEERYNLEREQQNERDMRIVALNAAATVNYGGNATASDVLDTARDFLAFVKGAAN
jgi:hypothetical protein